MRRRSGPAPEGAVYPRIPFATAISDPLLFKAGFEQLSFEQQTVLRIVYGQPLDAAGLRLWSAFNGFGVYDDLGYLVDLKGTLPYAPTEYEDITLIVGRRSGKSDRIASFVIAYEALLGGHKAHLANKRQDPVFLQVAQDLTTAKGNLRQFILNWLESSPVGKAELAKRPDATTADNIRIDSGLIMVGPPTIKLRSQAIATCAMDELAVWPKDTEAANPDIEVENAVRPALAQFPFRKLFKVSTPWTEEGLLWAAAQMGTQGRLLSEGDPRKAALSKVLVLRAPTAAMGNPVVPKAYLVQERRKDPDAFRREFLAEFSKSVSSFLNVSLLRASVARGVTLRPPVKGRVYVATMDPAFRKDAFAFCIGHMEKGVFTLDYLDAEKGTSLAPISPTARMKSIASTCKMYGVSFVTTDQYHDLSLDALAQEHGLSVWPLPFTNKVKQQVWGDVQSLLGQKRLSLLDDPFLLEELMGIEKHLTPTGQVQISGKRDDRATVVALAIHKALEMGEPPPPKEEKPKTDADRAHDNFMRTQQGGGMTPWWNQ